MKLIRFFKHIFLLGWRAIDWATVFAALAFVVVYLLIISGLGTAWMHMGLFVPPGAKNNTLVMGTLLLFVGITFGMIVAAMISACRWLKKRWNES